MAGTRVLSASLTIAASSLSPKTETRGGLGAGGRARERKVVSRAAGMGKSVWQVLREGREVLQGGNS